jgi:hypothetical protein
MNLPDHIQNLLPHGENYATDLLMETGEFAPFGVLTDAKGLTHHREVEVDLNDVPSNGEIIEELETYFKDQFENYDAKGYAIACEASVQMDEETKTDAVAIDIRFKDEKNIPLFYIPYTMNWDTRHAAFGKMFAVKRDE